MSTNLYYEPVVEKETYLGKDLKYEIAPFLWGHDGTLGGQQVLVGKETEFYNEGDEIVLYQFLKGLARGSDDRAKEAKKLIDLIDEHGEVYLSLKG